MAKVPCPKCSQRIYVGRTLRGKIPVEGDVNICEFCGSFLTYLNDGKVRAFDKEELRRLEADDPMTWAYLQGVKDKFIERITEPHEIPERG